MKSLLKSKQVCEWLNIKPVTLSRMVKSNRIPYVLLATGKSKLSVRFAEDELERWIERRSRGAVPPTKNWANRQSLMSGAGAEVDDDGAGKFCTK